MAFVTMIFAYMVIAGVIAMVIAGTISTIGLIVLIISLIRRHRAKVRGETPKKFGLITGWILFLLPIFVVISFSLLVCLNIELVEVEIMLDQIIKNCLDQMQEKNLIMEDNREYYQYAMELLVEESLTVGTILVVIICMQEFVNGVIFLISFLALRRRTGGFHMKTFKACYVATIGTFIGVLLVKNIMYTYSKLLLVFTCIAASYLLIVGTMNHPNIDMDKIELLASKKCARMVCIIELLMIIVGMQIRNFEEISIMISLAIILCSVSMKLAQLVRQKI